MKDTDILNIRRILEYRKIKPYFKGGGDLNALKPYLDFDIIK